MNELLKGKLVRLAAVDPEEFGKTFASWNYDSEFKRLMDADPARQHSPKKTKEWAEKHLNEAGNDNFWFTIRTLEDDRLLGDIGLEITGWSQRDAFVGLGIGPREFWGRGYGTEAMQLVLQYGFLELNLHRITLDVFEYNPRAIKSYEKVGFRREGTMRGRLLREGRRWDMVFMGILRSEWMEKNGYSITNQ